MVNTRTKSRLLYEKGILESEKCEGRGNVMVFTLTMHEHFAAFKIQFVMEGWG